MVITLILGRVCELGGGPSRGRLVGCSGLGLTVVTLILGRDVGCCGREVGCSGHGSTVVTLIEGRVVGCSGPEFRGLEVGCSGRGLMLVTLMLTRVVDSPGRGWMVVTLTLMLKECDDEGSSGLPGLGPMVVTLVLGREVGSSDLGGLMVVTLMDGRDVGRSLSLEEEVGSSLGLDVVLSPSLGLTVVTLIEGLVMGRSGLPCSLLERDVGRPGSSEEVLDVDLPGMGVIVVGSSRGVELLPPGLPGSMLEGLPIVIIDVETLVVGGGSLVGVRLGSSEVGRPEPELGGGGSPVGVRLDGGSSVVLVDTVGLELEPELDGGGNLVTEVVTLGGVVGRVGGSLGLVDESGEELGGRVLIGEDVGRSGRVVGLLVGLSGLVVGGNVLIVSLEVSLGLEDDPEEGGGGRKVGVFPVEPGGGGRVVGREVGGGNLVTVIVTVGVVTGGREIEMVGRVCDMHWSPLHEVSVVPGGNVLMMVVTVGVVVGGRGLVRVRVRVWEVVVSSGHVQVHEPEVNHGRQP